MENSLNENINRLRKIMRLDEGTSKYTVDITADELIRRVPFLRYFKNYSDDTRLQFQHMTYNENVELYNPDGEPVLFKQFNLSSEFNYSIVDMGDNRHRFMLSLVHKTWLMPPELKEPEQALLYRVMTMAMTKQMESFDYRYDEVLDQETLTKEQWDQIINNINKSFIELEEYLDDVLPVELDVHLKEGEVFDEARSSDYLAWKRKNVTIRGVKEAGEENNAGAMLGRGLYTAFLSNKELARQYGKVYFVLGAMPKNPKVFNTLNEWEIWFYNTLVYKYSKEKGSKYPDKRDFTANTTIEDEMQKLGYDGIVIKGREMVNFKPEDNIKYFSTEDQLENYYETVVREPLDEEKKKKADRCLRIARRKYDKPSAYRSGAIVQCRRGKIWKDLKEEDINEAPEDVQNLIYKAHDSITRTKGKDYAPDVHELQAWVDDYLESEEGLEEAKKTDYSKEKKDGLHGWFSRRGGGGSKGWVDCNTCRTVGGKKKCKACGRQDGEKRAKYPSCRPTPASCGTPGKGKKWGKTKEESYDIMNEAEEKEKKRIALLFIVIDNKVLLFKRSPEETTNPGKYGMLGGHIEKGESPEEALKREIKEEAGVELGSFKKLKTYELDDVQLNVFYTNEFDTENIKLDKKEHTAKKFFTLEELDEMSPEECIETNKGIARDYNKKAKEDKQLNEELAKIKKIINF